MKIDRFGLYNNDGKQVCICRFIEEYEKRSNFIRYFSRPIFYSFYSKVLGDMIRLTTTVEEGCTAQCDKRAVPCLYTVVLTYPPRWGILGFRGDISKIALLAASDRV